MRTIELYGAYIKSLDDFYDQIEKHLSLGECPWGRNLDSLDEIVLYNFNYTENRELDVRKIIWKDAKLSENNLLNDKRAGIFSILIETLSENKTINLVLT